MGYLHKVRKNLWPIEKVMLEEIMKIIVEDPSENYLPPRKIQNPKHIVQVTAVKFNDRKGILSSDQTGAFPNMSTQRNRYIMVTEDSDAGPILRNTNQIKKERTPNRESQTNAWYTDKGGHQSSTTSNWQWTFEIVNRRNQIKRIAMSNCTKRKP